MDREIWIGILVRAIVGILTEFLSRFSADDVQEVLSRASHILANFDLQFEDASTDQSVPIALSAAEEKDLYRQLQGTTT